MTVLESKVEGRPPSPEDKEEVRGIGFLRTNTFHFLHNTLFSFILHFDHFFKSSKTTFRGL